MRCGQSAPMRLARYYYYAFVRFVGAGDLIFTNKCSIKCREAANKDEGHVMGDEVAKDSWRNGLTLLYPKRRDVCRTDDPYELCSVKILSSTRERDFYTQLNTTGNRQERWPSTFIGL